MGEASGVLSTPFASPRAPRVGRRVWGFVWMRGGPRGLPKPPVLGDLLPRPSLSYWAAPNCPKAALTPPGCLAPSRQGVVPPRGGDPLTPLPAVATIAARRRRLCPPPPLRGRLLERSKAPHPLAAAACGRWHLNRRRAASRGGGGGGVNQRLLRRWMTEPSKRQRPWSFAVDLGRNFLTQRFGWKKL